MIRNSLANKFIFNEKIDNEYVHSLYHDDYSYICEIFQTTLEHFDGDLNGLQQAYAAGDLAGVKKAAHKLKPVFGFTGMLELQEQMNDFENHCLAAQNISAVAAQYQQLLAEIVQAKAIIGQEQQRLAEFTASQS